MDDLLNIEDLTVKYETDGGIVTALDSVNLVVRPKEFLAVVGESGCGKTTLGLSVIGLLPQLHTKIAGGRVDYKGANLLAFDKKQIRAYRGTEISMIFQEPLTSLNPVYKVGDQMAEAILVKKFRENRKKAHGEVMQKVYDRRSAVARLPVPGRKLPEEVRDEIIEWLNMVRIADPEQILDRYPFELSGGMTQRVMIAMALSQEPALLIADEPTTALDVTTQAQVLNLMAELMGKVNTSVIMITHDLAVASQVADRIVVMYAGEVAEDAEVHRLFSEPRHPYTKGLLGCVPNGTKDGSTLKPIPGSIPDLSAVPRGCRFSPRCPYSFDRCVSNRPTLIKISEDQRAACFLYDR